ncbi:MAG: hypothetical protein QG639_537 [Patescibacteria group bacterium]|jgi:hypothetical protein|nr:hypothetical protein [Patescibacteria group bacterium]
MKLVTTFILLFTAFSLAASHTHAFSCDTSPDHWFIETTKFNQQSLPSELVVTSLPNKEFNTYLSNPTANSIYIVEKAPEFVITDFESPSAIFDDPEVPAGYRPLFKLINNSYYTWGQKEDGNIGWVTYPGQEQVAVSRKILTTEEEPQLYWGDNRPADVELPPLVPFSIIIYGNGRLSNIQGTIEYELNPDYDPTAGATKLAACDKAQTAWLMSISDNPLQKIIGFILSFFR